MGKILPKRKFFKSSIYSPKLNVGSHIDNVRNSLENLIFSNEKEVGHSLLIKRIKVVVVLTILFMIVGSILSPKGKAEVVIFYPTTCLGGWMNPRNAEGEPQTKSNDDEEQFTKDNSAILLATTSADIYCGNFIGQIEQNTKPTKIIVSLSWSKGENILLEQKITGESFASSSGEILDSASTTNVSFTLSSSTEASSTVQLDTASTSEIETSGETSIINKVIDVVGSTLENLFGGEQVDVSSQEVSTTTKEEIINSVEPSEPSVPTTETPVNPITPTPEPEAPVNPISPTSEPEVPPTESAPTSFLETILQKFATYFVMSVFAEEVVSSSTEIVNDIQTPEKNSITTTTTTPEIPATVSLPEEIVTQVDIVSTSSTSTLDIGIASTTESTSTESSSSTPVVSIVIDDNSEDQSPNNFLEVLYTFDGTTWRSLGKVNEASMKYRTFEIPVTATTSWSDMNQLQIKVQPIQRIDVAPTIYLDGIKVEVLYETPVIHPHPDFVRDTILKDTSDDGVRVVSIINSDTNNNEIWYTTLENQGDYGVAPGSWVQVKLDSISYTYKLIDIYGQNLFWVDDASKLLWVTNLQKSTNDGIGLVLGATTTAMFTKTNGEEWIFEYNNTTKVGFARIKQ